MWRVRGRKLRWKRKWKLRWKRKWRRKWRRAKRRGGRSRKGAESRGERGVVYGWGRCQGRSQWGVWAWSMPTRFPGMGPGGGGCQGWRAWLVWEEPWEEPVGRGGVVCGQGRGQSRGWADDSRVGGGVYMGGVKGGASGERGVVCEEGRGGGRRGEENAPPGRCWVEGGEPEPPEVEPEVWVTGSSAGAKGRGKGGGARDS